jgi:hypothetical protein
MLYRKSSPHPPKLLLRVVAAGAGAALVAACSSGGDTQTHYPANPEAGSDASHIPGVVPLHDGGTD